MIKELLPEIWKNKSQIAEGIKNLAFKKEHIEKLAIYRKEICKNCIWFNQNQKNKSFDEIPEVIIKTKDKSWIKDLTSIESERCMHCGCGIGENSVKLRSTSAACPIGKWFSLTTIKEEDHIQKIISDND